MIGIVLSGGKSTRMGTDKGLMVEDGLNWAQLAFSKLQGLIDEVYVSVSSAQADKYGGSFGNKLIVDDPSLPIGGPVLGLLSAHIAHPKKDILVLACDMPRMESAPIEYLLQQYKETSGMETYLFANDNGLQPLMAIYTSTLLERILQNLQAGTLTTFSVKYLVDISKSYQAIVPETWQRYFVNYNSHEDMHPPRV
jgi:molybdopterin-guanine dinucleotide biosynthesis protein A